MGREALPESPELFVVVRSESWNQELPLRPASLTVWRGQNEHCQREVVAIRCLEVSHQTGQELITQFFGINQFSEQNRAGESVEKADSPLHLCAA